MKFPDLPLSVGLAMIGKVTEDKLGSGKLELFPPPAVYLPGQMFLVMVSPLMATQPWLVHSKEDDLHLLPMTKRWYSDHCSECKTELLNLISAQKDKANAETTVQ